MTRRAAAALLAAASALALSGCAGAGGPGSASAPASPAPTTAAPTGALQTPLPVQHPSGRPLTLPVHRAGSPANPGPLWTLAAPASGSTVTVAWSGSPSPDCGAVDGVWVTETASVVVIALGAHARSAHHVCPLVLVPHTTAVVLAAPLGARRLSQPAPRR